MVETELLLSDALLLMAPMDNLSMFYPVIQGSSHKYLENGLRYFEIAAKISERFNHGVKYKCTFKITAIDLTVSMIRIDKIEAQCSNNGIYTYVRRGSPN